MSEMNNSPQVNEETTIDLGKIFARIIDHWKWFVLSIVLFLLLAFMYLLYTSPVYKVNATVMVEDDKSSGAGAAGSKALGGMLGDLGSLMSMNSSVDNELQVLQTKDLTEKVIKDMNLNITYYDNGKIGSPELYKDCPFVLTPLFDMDAIHTPIIAKVSYVDNTHLSVSIKEKNKNETIQQIALGGAIKTSVGNFKISATGFVPANGVLRKYGIAILPIESSIEQYNKNLKVEQPKSENGSALLLQMTTAVPEKGVHIMDTLIHEYIFTNLNQKNAFADSTILFINQRLNIVEQELSHAEAGLQVFKEENKIADIKTQAEETIKNTSDYQKQSNEVDVKLSVIETMIAYVKNRGNNHSIVPSILSTPDPTYLKLLENYNALLTYRSQLSLSRTDENPTMVSNEAQIATARRDLLNNMENMRRDLLIGQKKIQSQNAVLNNAIAQVPRQQRQYLSISRQQEIKQGLYLYMLQRREEMLITKSSNIPTSRIIDRPRAETVPTSPKRSIIYFAALLLGVILPYIYFFLREILSKKITSVEDVTEINAATVVGEISHSHENSHETGVSPRSVLAEQLRTLRTNIQFVTKAAQSTPVILFTSSVSGEGKSFIALNLSRIYASLGKRVVMIDLDLRRPRLAENLSLGGTQKGYTNFMVSQSDYTNFVTKTDIPNFDTILSGPIPPNPLELLQDDKTSHLIAQLKKDYDVVLIDTAPVGLVADAQVLSAHSSIILYITRLNYSYKQHLKMLKNLIKDGKLPSLYLIINDVIQKKSSGYGYGYGYGYGSYDADKENKNKWWKKFFNFNKHKNNK